LNKFQSKIGTKGIFITVSFIVIVLIVDTSIVRISAITGGLSSTGPGTAIFILFATTFAVGQYLILGFVRKRNEENRSIERLRLNIIHKSVSIIQYVLIAIFVILILQMLFTSSYDLRFLELVILINYILAIALLGFLSYRFLSWFRSNHNPAVLAYALATMMIGLNAVFTIVYVTYQLSGTQGGPIIRPAMTPVANFSSIFDIFNAGYVVTSVMSFILTWIATVILLHGYSRKLGTTKYWILVSIPLLYFLSQYQALFLNLFTAYRLSEPILFGVVYTFFFSATIPAGGILFGVAFWSVAKKLRRSVVKQYMMISAYGMMLLFSSNQAFGLVLVPYPPFGLTTVSFFGLASYLIFIGVYSSAISVAEDSNLRRSIRSIAMSESRLLDSIGSAEMEREIQNRVINLTKRSQDRMMEETGIQASLTEDDMKQYLEQVIREVKMQKNSTGKTNHSNE